MRKRSRVLDWSVLWVCALVAAAGLAAHPASGPQIEFPQTTFNFGTIYQNEEVSYSFVFRNVGDDVLKIKKVQSTCGCTAALSDKRELAPGESGEVRITFKAGSMEGPVSKQIYVESNDPLRERVFLTIVGRVEVEVRVTPSGMYLGSLPVGGTLERSFEVRSVSGKEFKILKTTVNHAALHVERPVPLRDKGGGYRLTITFGPEEKAGRVSAKVILQTDLEHGREVTISVYGRVGDPEDSKQPGKPG